MTILTYPSLNMRTTQEPDPALSPALDENRHLVPNYFFYRCAFHLFRSWLGLRVIPEGWSISGRALPSVPGGEAGREAH